MSLERAIGSCSEPTSKLATWPPVGCTSGRTNCGVPGCAAQTPVNTSREKTERQTDRLKRDMGTGSGSGEGFGTQPIYHAHSTADEVNHARAGAPGGEISGSGPGVPRGRSARPFALLRPVEGTGR